VLAAIPDLGRLPVSYAALLALLALAAASARISPDALLARQTQLQRDVGHREFNDSLCQYVAHCGTDGEIVSDYLLLAFVPGLERRYRCLGSPSAAEFRQTYSRPEVGFALVHQGTCPPVVACLEESCRSGESRIVWEFGDYRLFKKIGGRYVGRRGDSRL
jgi:hypothetical protein